MKDIGAGRGKRSPKSGQSNYFVGYKKHSVYGLFHRDGQWGTVPLYSILRSANITDVEMLDPLLDYVLKTFRKTWPMIFALGDKGYVSGERARRLREQWGVALLVRPKNDMVTPPECDDDGCPLCSLGERLIWEGYDPLDGVLLYACPKDNSATCGLRATCDVKFEFPSSRHETFWGMLPWHSHLAQRLMRKFRPRVEASFNISKNKYRLKEFFINSKALGQTLCVLCDIVETLETIALRQPERGVELKNALSRDIKQPELWD